MSYLVLETYHGVVFDVSVPQKFGRAESIYFIFSFLLSFIRHPPTPRFTHHLIFSLISSLCKTSLERSSTSNSATRSSALTPDRTRKGDTTVSWTIIRDVIPTATRFRVDGKNILFVEYEQGQRQSEEKKIHRKRYESRQQSHLRKTSKNWYDWSLLTARTVVLCCAKQLEKKNKLMPSIVIICFFLDPGACTNKCTHKQELQGAQSHCTKIARR
jgi:hypothetical protein